jgi:hypothetical protein
MGVGNRAEHHSDDRPFFGRSQNRPGWPSGSLALFVFGLLFERLIWQWDELSWGNRISSWSSQPHCKSNSYAEA